MTWQKLLLTYLGAGFIRAYFKLMRFEFFGRETETALFQERADVLYAGWHHGFLLDVYLYRDTQGATIISQSRDGEIIATICKHLGIRSFRGSSSKGGAEALADMVAYIKAGHIGGLSPDGPTGPPYVSKLGIIQMAARTGSPLLAFAWDAYPSHEFNSWDRTILPLPFSRIAVLYDREPFYVPAGLSLEEYEAYGRAFDQRMNALAYQARYYIRNKLKNMDPRDIPVPENHMDYLPRRQARNKGR